MLRLANNVTVGDILLILVLCHWIGKYVFQNSFLKMFYEKGNMIPDAFSSLLYSIPAMLCFGFNALSLAAVNFIALEMKEQDTIGEIDMELIMHMSLLIYIFVFVSDTAIF